MNGHNLFRKNIFNNRWAGITGVTILSLIILFVFYGRLLTSLNTAFFSLSGDGIQSYFNSTYLAKYDTSLFFSHSMNYPYGELSFYTQGQPLVIGPVKFISQHFFDISGSIVGIINFLMLSSILIGAVFIFLLFIELGLPSLFAAFAGTGIAFLSPQIDRMAGHFTLSYVWAIPVLLWLLFRFHKTQKLRYSFYIGITLFLLITGHVYFAAFYFAVLAGYWLYRIFCHKRVPFRNVIALSGQFFLQFILPVMVFYFITSFFNDRIPNRPSSPYGFLIYKASPESIFLPVSVDYGLFLHKLFDFGDIQWEGIAYIGIISVAGFFVIVIGSITGLFRKQWQKIFKVTDNELLNLLFWISLILLAYSFGIPFVFNLEFLADYMGPLRQMRALGRFAWLFYYVINIIVIYKLWKWQVGKSWKPVIVVLAILILFIDVYFYSKGRQKIMNNRYTEWTDNQNKLTRNAWTGHINASEYQSIIPLPFYHMGSDNFNIPLRCDMLAKSYLVSAKTGLPLLSIYISRASVTQSVKNIAIGLEPYRPYEILNDLSSKKPFLIVAAKCNELTTDELNLINNSIPVDSNDSFTLYRLEFDTLASLYSQKAEHVKNIASTLQVSDSLITSFSGARIFYRNFNENTGVHGYVGNGIVFKGQDYFSLFNETLNNKTSGPCKISFWLNPVTLDKVPKTRLLVELFDQSGAQYEYLNVMCGDYMKTFDGPWGMVEFAFKVEDPDDRIQVTVYNDLIGKTKSYCLDEVLIRPDSCDVFFKANNFLMWNNRWYH